MNNEENTPVLAGPKKSASAAPSFKSILDTSVKVTNLIWNLLLLAVAITVGCYIAPGFAPEKQPEGLNDFIGMASPIENVPQQFSIGKHNMPSVEVMAPLSEVERQANPSFTAAQLQRAKWMDRTLRAVRARNETAKAVNKDGKSYAVEFVQSVLAKNKEDSGSARVVMSARDIAELSSINVLVGIDIIPSLASGLLPVLSDAETALWKEEVTRQQIKLSVLDMRRAKYFQNKLGTGVVPAKSPDDEEIRAEEKLMNVVKPRTNMFLRQPTWAAPLSENERLELAVGVLNTIAVLGPTPVAAAK